MESENKNISLKDLIPKIEKIISNDKNIEDFKISIEKLNFELPEVNEIIELAKSNKFHEIALKCNDDNYNYMIDFYKENGIIDSIINKFIENCYHFQNSDKESIFISFLEVVIHFFKDSITTSKSKYVESEYMGMYNKKFVNKIKINEKIKIYYISLDSNIVEYTQIGFPNSIFPNKIGISSGFYYIHKLSLYDTSTNKINHEYLQKCLNHYELKYILYPKSCILSPQQLDTKIKNILNSLALYSPINFNKLNDFNETVKLVCNNLITECRFYENFYITDQYKSEIENLKTENVNLKIENGNLKNKKEKLKKDIENLKNEKEKFKKWNEILKNQYDNLKTEIDQLNEEKHKLKIEIHDYSISLDPILQQLRNLRDPRLSEYKKYFKDEYLKINKKVEQINGIENSMNLYFQNQYEKLKSAKDRINTYIEVLEKSMKEVENEKQINQEKFEEEKNKFIKIYEEKTSEYQNMIDHFDEYVTTELQKKLAEQIKLFKEFNEKDWDANIKYKFIEKVLNSATANKSSDLRVSDLEFKDLNEVLKCLQIFNMFELCANENNSKKIKRFTFEFLNKINEFISKMPNQK